MRELEINKKIDIIEKKLEGKSFDQIADELKISKSTAFRVWKEFESGNASYITNKDAYLLSKELTDIAKTMREKGMTASDFLEVYYLWELVHRRKINISQGIEYINALESSADPESMVSTMIGIFKSAENKHIDPKSIIDFLLDNFDKKENIQSEIKEIQRKIYQLESERKRLNVLLKKYRKKVQEYKNEVNLVKYLRKRFDGRTEDLKKLFQEIGRNGFRLEILPELLEIRNIMQRQNIRGRDIEEILINMMLLINHGITPNDIKRMVKNLGNSNASEVYKEMIKWLSHKNELTQSLQDLINERDKLRREKERLNTELEEIKDNIKSIQDKEKAELQYLSNIINEENNEKLKLSMFEKKRKEQEAWLDFLMKSKHRVNSDIDTYLQLVQQIAAKKRELREMEQNLRDLNDLQKNLMNLIRDLGMNIGDCLKAKEILEKNKEIIDRLPELTERIKKLMSKEQLNNDNLPIRVFKLPYFRKESKNVTNE
jgi:DNA repair exonuclease SbcCD ATPase subunit